MFTPVGYCEKSDPLITQPGAPNSVRVVYLMHDTRHKKQQWYQSDKSCKL